METGRSGRVPEFGAVVRRDRLLKVFLGQRPSLTLICAPAGYGKSVLSAQLTDVGGYDRTLWVSDVDNDASGEQLIIRAASAISTAWADAQPLAPSIVSHDDALLSVGLSLRNRENERLCIVLDGCRSLVRLAPLQELADLVRGLTSSVSAVIVTCRTASGSEPLDPRRVWAVEAPDLRFNPEEVLHLLAISGSDAHQSAETYFSRYGGHPALTSLMVRHVGLDEIRSAPKDLVWYVDRLVRDLSPDALRLLYVGSLLKQDVLEAWIVCAGTKPAPSLWGEVQTLLPLVVLPEARGGESVFRVHDVLCDSVYRLADARIDARDLSDLRSRVIEHLAGMHAHTRVLQLMMARCGTSELVGWLRLHGTSLLRSCGPEALMQVINAVDPGVISGSAQLLLLRAGVLREQERYSEARETAALSASLAEADGDQSTWQRAWFLAARVDIDSGRWGTLSVALARLEAERGVLDPHSLSLLDAYTAVAYSQAGNMPGALARADRALESLASMDDFGSDDAVFTVNGLAAVLGVYSGRWTEAATLLGMAAKRDDLSPCQRFMVRANLAVCLMELGSLREARALLDEVIEAAETSGLKHIAVHAYGTRSGVFHALSDTERGRRDYEACERLVRELGLQDLRVAEQVQAAMSLRADTQFEEALSLVEEATLIVKRGTAGYLIPDHIISLEMAACLLSMGDAWAAERQVTAILASTPMTAPAALRAALICAEARRQMGQRDTAGIVGAHHDHLLSGCANRLAALYIRAFPGLLGVLVQAVGAENIPLRMLLMIPTDTMEQGFELAGLTLSDEDKAVLRRRRGSATQPALESSDSVAPHPCYVRLFGGLEVTAEAGVVSEGMWRKRKARLMFIMLVLRQHQDVPRDVLLERLWPDMDEEHAKRNFYVTWSTMKRALACGGAPSQASELVQCSGGVCRAGRQVRSDLDDFDESVATLRTSAAEGDAESAVREARRLVHLYRGELLPGDLYEEWFAEVRERAKHDFCDAMMTAATLAARQGDADVALLFLRRASAADPWREDVYQATMRCQMDAGQRSRAIETYLSCRSRLTEDLGIDPSVETTRLYQAVLALEDEGNSVRSE